MKHPFDILPLNSGQLILPPYLGTNGGSGRTGLMTAILMTQLGYSKADATAQVQRLPPKALYHRVHRTYFYNFTA